MKKHRLREKNVCFIISGTPTSQPKLVTAAGQASVLGHQILVAPGSAPGKMVNAQQILAGDESSLCPDISKYLMTGSYITGQMAHQKKDRVPTVQGKWPRKISGRKNMGYSLILPKHRQCCMHKFLIS